MRILIALALFGFVTLHMALHCASALLEYQESKIVKAQTLKPDCRFGSQFYSFLPA